MTLKSHKELGSWSEYWKQFPTINRRLNGVSVGEQAVGERTVGEHMAVGEQRTVGEHLDCKSARTLYINARPAPGKSAQTVKVGILCSCGQAVIDPA